MGLEDLWTFAVFRPAPPSSAEAPGSLCIFAGQGKAHETSLGGRSFDVAPAAAHVKGLRRSATGATKVRKSRDLQTHGSVITERGF